MTSNEACAAAWLLSAQAVRSRARCVLELAERDAAPHFSLHLERLDRVADYVADVVRRAYPSLHIPPHSRWRHFTLGGVDRWAGLARTLTGVDAAERARIRIDLAVISVLLDAGAGPAWRYRDRQSGERYARSEGLALASFDLFAAGVFSLDPDDPLRVDASALVGVDQAALTAGFQAGADNPLLGLTGRCRLLRALGEALVRAPQIFGATEPRPGKLLDALYEQSSRDTIAAAQVLQAVLRGLGPIWPGRESLDGANLGDCWSYAPIAGADSASSLVPFHKLSQWLAYSLVEPLEEAGLRVTDLDGLTGLAEYRNGGLFLDAGVLCPRDPTLWDCELAVGDEVVVEWRALTVALLDRLAPLLREKLGLSAEQLPLVAVLEGGTWAAGRRLARERRADGGPPLRIRSDGTVF